MGFAHQTGNEKAPPCRLSARSKQLSSRQRRRIACGGTSRSESGSVCREVHSGVSGCKLKHQRRAFHGAQGKSPLPRCVRSVCVSERASERAARRLYSALKIVRVWPNEGPKPGPPQANHSAHGESTPAPNWPAVVRWAGDALLPSHWPTGRNVA